MLGEVWLWQNNADSHVTLLWIRKFAILGFFVTPHALSANNVVSKLLIDRALDYLHVHHLTFILEGKPPYPVEHCQMFSHIFLKIRFS